MFEGELLTLGGLFGAALVMGMLAAIAGIGGGILITSFMSAFTPVHINYVRSLGLAFVITKAAFAQKKFITAGLTNLRIMTLGGMADVAGAVFGAWLGLYLVHGFGKWGEGLVRALLGVLVLFVAYLLLRPERAGEVRPTARGASWLSGRYYDPGEKRWVEYSVERPLLGFSLVFLIGVMSGFFGVGAGWLMLAVLIYIMKMPLKAAAASANAFYLMGTTPALWVYIWNGAVSPALLAVTLPGTMIGSIIGAAIMVRARVRFVKYVISGVFVYTGFENLRKGLTDMGVWS